MIMKKVYNDIELLERYQRGLCSTREIDEVESRLAEDPEFRNLSGDMEMMIEGISRTARKSTLEDKIALLQKAFDEVGDPDETASGKMLSLDPPSSNNTIKVLDLFNRYKLGIAASVIILIASWIIFVPSGQPTTDELFQSYFEPYQNLNSQLRDGQQEETDASRAYRAYESGEYEKAVLHFETMEANNEERLTHLFYQANSYLAIGEAEKAIGLFGIVSQSSSIFNETAKWYLALSYLKTREIDKSRQLFHEIADTNNGFSKRAREILKKLNQS